MMKVLKFGGTSMGSAKNMRQAAGIIKSENANITALSAMSGTTDALVKISALAAQGDQLEEIDNILTQLSDKYTACVVELLDGNKQAAIAKIAEAMETIRVEAAGYDRKRSEKIILSQGELLTSAIFTMYLTETGCKSALLNALDFMRKTADGLVDTEHLANALAKLDPDTHYITQGFICRDSEGNADNLGRGGSDYSAALIGAAINASQVQIWTDIDGMHNNDPRVVDRTFPIRTMHFDEAAELAYFGAKILHPSTIQPCKEKGIPVMLKNTMEPEAPGTTISNSEENRHTYRAIAAKDGIIVVRIYSTRMLMAYGFLRKVFEVFEKYETPIDMITTSEVAVSLTIDNSRNLEAIEAELQEFGAIEIERDNTIVCVVGRIDHKDSGRALDIMQAVGDVPLKMISYGASHRGLAMLTETKHKTRLLQNLNEGLFFRN